MKVIMAELCHNAHAENEPNPQGALQRNSPGLTEASSHNMTRVKSRETCSVNKILLKSCSGK